MYYGAFVQEIEVEVDEVPQRRPGQSDFDYAVALIESFGPEHGFRPVIVDWDPDPDHAIADAIHFLAEFDDHDDLDDIDDIVTRLTGS